MTRRNALWVLALVAVGPAAIAFLTRYNEVLTIESHSIQLKDVSAFSKPFTFCSSPLPQSASSSSSQNTRGKDSPPDSTKKSLCQRLGDGRTASSTWSAHLRGILQASIHPMDVGRVHKNWTKQLLDFVTPELMERALRTQPSYKDIDRIIQIIDKRLHNSSSPPLHVGVFGGSVTEGKRMDMLYRRVDTRNSLPNIVCRLFGSTPPPTSRSRSRSLTLFQDPAATKFPKKSSLEKKMVQSGAETAHGLIVCNAWRTTFWDTEL
jgi:hypothetical protein